jgi:hypothetical protein
VPEITEWGWMWLVWMPPSGRMLIQMSSKHQLAALKVELQILGEGGDMGVERLHQRVEDREAPGQVGERGVGRVAGIAVFLAPRLPRLVILGDGEARRVEFFGVHGGTKSPPAWRGKGG